MNFGRVKCSVVKFIQREFIDKLIMKGRFFCISEGEQIDKGNVFAILPTGKMILSLDKDTFEQLGISGASSPFRVLKGHRFSILKFHFFSDCTSITVQMHPLI